MSSTVKSAGFVAILAMPLSKEKREIIEERLYDERSNLSINYDGTLIYSDVYRYAGYREREDIYGLVKINTDASEFLKELAEQCFIISSDPKPYFNIWYNGVDSEISMLTLEQFKEM